MNIYRTCVLSPQARRIHEILSGDPAIWVIKAYDSEVDAYSLLTGEGVDLLILDEAMPGIDPLHLLRRLEETPMAHPRVLYITGDPAHDPRQTTDAWIKPDFDAIELYQGVHWAIKSTHGQLSKAMQKRAEEIANRLCTSLDMPVDFKGHPYLCKCIAWQALSTAPLTMTNLYDLVAHDFDVSPASAERCIRACIEFTWLHGNLEAISGLFGYTVDPEKGKPTNMEFISMLARHVKDRLQQKG